MSDEGAFTKKGQQAAIARRLRPDFQAGLKTSIMDSLVKASAMQELRAKAAADQAVTWSIPEAVAWIAWRSLRHMPLMSNHGFAHLLTFENAHRVDTERPSGEVRSEIQTASRLLWTALIKGQLAVSGRPLDGSRPGQIEPILFAQMIADWNENALRWIDDHQHAYRNPSLIKEDVQRLWPIHAEADSVEPMAEPETLAPIVSTAAIVSTAPRRGRKKGAGAKPDDALMAQVSEKVAAGTAAYKACEEVAAAFLPDDATIEAVLTVQKRLWRKWPKSHEIEPN